MCVNATHSNLIKLKNMKNKKILTVINISYMLVFLLGGVFIFSSCKDDNENGGPPIIERVRLTDPKTADKSLGEATLGSTLVIVGKNLKSTKMVYMNNYPVSINATYTTDQYLIVNVLDSIPTVATNKNAPNEIRVINAYGEAVYQFQILPPAPVIQKISNEFAKAGETITLYGKYFFFVDTVYFPGGMFTKDFTTSPNGSSLTVTLPAGFTPTPQDADIRVHSKSGKSSITRYTRFFDGEGMVSNFDAFNNYGYGIAASNISATPVGGFPAIDNKYAFINMAIPGNYDWDNNKYMHFTAWGPVIFPVTPKPKYDTATSVANPIANYDLKFELAVQASSLDDIKDLGVQMVGYDKANTELSYNVVLSDFVRSVDNKWYTITIPIGELVKDGKKMSLYKDLVLGTWAGNDANSPADDVNSMRVIIIKSSAGSSPPVKIGMDNFRIANNVYRP